MKNNKKLLALVVAGMLTGPVMASEEVEASKEIKQSVSLIDVKQVKKDAIKHDQLSTQVSLLKLELERAQLQQQIAESNAAVESLHNQSNADSEKEALQLEFQAAQDEKEQVIQGLQEKIRQLETKKIVKEKEELKLDPLEKVFVTSIRGMGNNLTGQFYVDNNIVRARKGDTLTKDIFVENITANGALVRTKTETKFLPVTTIDQAFHKSQKVPLLNQEKYEKNNSGRRQ